MTIVVIYTDFDGTITRREGRSTVSTQFYSSLYNTYNLKSPQECNDLFIAKFGKYDDSFNWNQEDTDILMSADAVQFFHYALQNPEVKVNIITRNGADYVQALFRYQGFTDEEINKLEIVSTGQKGVVVADNINKNKYNANEVDVYIMDDNKSDYESMKQQTYEWADNRIHGDHKNAGEFNWNQYLNEIQTILSSKITNNSDKEVLNDNDMSCKTMKQPISSSLNQNNNDLDWGKLTDDERCNISVFTKSKRQFLFNCATSDYWATLNDEARQKLLSYSTKNKWMEDNQLVINNLAIEIDKQILTCADSIKQEKKVTGSIFQGTQGNTDKKTNTMNVLMAARDILTNGSYPAEYLQDKEASNPGWDAGEEAVNLVNRVKKLMNIPLKWENSENLKVDISIK